MNAELKIVNGEFIRSESGFRNWVTKDGSAGPTGEAGFAAEPGRYHRKQWCLPCWFCSNTGSV